MIYRDLGVLIPYMTTDGDRAMLRLRFKGEVDRRKARKLMRKSLAPLGIKVNDNRVLNFYLKHRSYDLGYDQA